MSRLWVLGIILAVIMAPLVASLIVVWVLAVIPWWGLLTWVIIIGLVILWFAILFDLLRRADLQAWQIALWVVLIVLLPVIGAIVYYFARPPADRIRYRGESTP
jgi:hypothetical protein